MAYIRKTVDVWEIQGCYYYGVWEMVTTETSRKEARERIKEYRENAPMAYRIVKKREKIEKGA